MAGKEATYWKSDCTIDWCQGSHPRPKAIFSRVVVAVFKEYIHEVLEVYFDDWTVFGLLKKHVEALRLMLAKCRQHQISLYLKKCIFCVPFGILLGHIICRQGLMVDPMKIAIIVNLPPPNLVR